MCRYILEDPTLITLLLTRRQHIMFYLEFIELKLKTWVVNESVRLTEHEWTHSTTVVGHSMANCWVVKTSHLCHVTDLMPAHFCYSLKWKPPLKDFRMWGHQGKSNCQNKCSSFGCNGWPIVDVFERYKAANGALHTKVFSTIQMTYM
jgi:hypothetical protein